MIGSGSSCSQGSSHTHSIQPTQDRGRQYGSTPVKVSQPSFGKLWKSVASLRPRKVKAPSHQFGPWVPVWNLQHFKEAYSFFTHNEMYIILRRVTSSCRTVRIQNQKPTLSTTLVSLEYVWLSRIFQSHIFKHSILRCNKQRPFVFIVTLTFYSSLLLISWKIQGGFGTSVGKSP